MATITLEIPDELATELAPLQAELPNLLGQTLARIKREKTMAARTNQAGSPIYLEALDFLASLPSREQVASYTVSASLQTRVEELLERNRNEGLSTKERAEMDTYLQVNHLMGMLKTRVRKAMKQSAAAS